MPKVGDVISLREWTGKPYRSKQRVLRSSVITKVAEIQILHDVFFLLSTELCIDVFASDVDTFARDDGFNDWDDLLDWFTKNHQLPFYGIIIKWS